MKKTTSLAKWGVAVLLLSSLSSCEDILEQYFPKPTPPPTIPVQPVAYATYATRPLSGMNEFENKLLVFNPATLTPIRQLPITGLSATDYILGIDRRPATGELYALVGTNNVSGPFILDFVSNSRLYTLNPATGAATLVAPLSIPFLPITGSNAWGFDFNPVTDRIRVITADGENLRVNPADGMAIADGRINGANARTGGAAYDNNFVGATTTNLYILDVNEDKLYLQNPPNSGTLTLIGSLGYNASFAGFDISGIGNKAYAIMNATPAGQGSGDRVLFYSINLTTGAVTELGDVGIPVGTRGEPAPFVTGFTLGTGF